MSRMSEDDRRSYGFDQRRSSVYDRRRTEVVVTFHPDNSEPTDGEFNDIFDNNNKSTPWFILMFFLSLMVTFSLEAERAAQLISKTIEGSCIFPELLANNWTMQMITNFTLPNHAQYCMYLDFDYEEVGKQTFIEAMEMKEKMSELPPTKFCAIPVSSKNYSWSRPNFLRTCASMKFRESASHYRSFGEILSLLINSIVGDIWGRKLGLYYCYPALVFGLILIIIANHYYVLCVGYFFEGFGHAGWSLLSYILFVEFCNPAVRGIYLLYLFSCGILARVIGYYIKYYTASYFVANLYCSLPSITLIFYLYYVPESPRWLLSYGRKRRAWHFLESLHVDISNYTFLPRISLPKSRIFFDNLQLLFQTRKYLRSVIGTGILLCIEAILYEQKTSYVRVKQLRIASHRMITLLGDVFSFFNVLPAFILFGRYVAIFAMHGTTVLYLILCIVIKSTEEWFVVNMLSVISLSSMQFIILLYCCELIPTCARATGLGATWVVSNILRFIWGYAFKLVVGERLLSMENVNAQNYTVLTLGLVGLLSILILPYYRVFNLPDFKRYRNVVET